MFDSIKRLFRGKPSYEIVQSETKTMPSAEGPKHVVLLAANLPAASGQPEMVTGLFERFKLQRMMSPPETSMLLITVIGPCDGATFVSDWRKLVAGDQVATFFMSRMEKADVGTEPAASRTPSEFRSLLSA